MRLHWILLALAARPAASWLAATRPQLARSARRAATPLLADVDVSDLPMRPPMVPGNIVDSSAAAAAEEAEAEAMVEETDEQRKVRVKAEMDAAVIGDASSKMLKPSTSTTTVICSSFGGSASTSSRSHSPAAFLAFMTSVGAARERDSRGRGLR